jgi:hypothetical protein
VRQLIVSILLAYFSMFSSPSWAQDSGSSFNEHRIVSRKISGEIFCTAKKKKKPLAGAKVQLIDYRKTLASAKTGKDGKYFLDVKVVEGESYEFKVTSTCGEATQNFRTDEDKESHTMNFNFQKD